MMTSFILALRVALKSQPCSVCLLLTWLFLGQPKTQRGIYLFHLSILPSPLTEIWDHFHRTLLKKYAYIYKGINVVVGPVFDYNYDGRYDTPEQIQRYV